MKTSIMLAACAALVCGCGVRGKDARPGQALASVNGQEITVLQLNDELARAGIGAGGQEAAGKQLLQALIDRQLLLSEAAREKLDRDPKVLQSIERAKALIVSQEYLQRRVGSGYQPTAVEVSEYFNTNPQYFAHRKQFAMQQMAFATRDLTDELKRAADAAKSLDDMAAWMDAHKVRYARADVTRTTADLSPDMTERLQAMAKGKLFIVSGGERSLLIAILDAREAPLTLDAAAPQIAQFLVARRNRETASAELARLRASAKIEYLNKSLATEPKPAPVAASADITAFERGVAGLK